MPDTHTHLEDPLFDVDRDAVLARARAAGIDRILVVGSDAASSARAVGLASRYREIYAAVGVHPHQATQFETDAQEVRTLIEQDKVVAIGEIGLDYYRQPVDRAVQMHVFRTQLEWARDTGLPVSVHSRDADQDVLDTLEEFGVRAILHCFTGSLLTARQALDRGYVLSFAGNLTYPRAGDLRETMAAVPLDRLLAETDSPVLAPQGLRGRRNEPENVVQVVRQMAEMRGLEPDIVADAISHNADQVFGWRSS